MVAFDVVEAISKLPLLNYVGVSDFTDKMNFIATCLLLIACSLIVSVREYIMDPISCYLSTNPGGENLVKFMENYCWVQGTMSIADHKIPTSDEEWRVFEQTRIIYYQWVPLMLLLQTTLFHTPKILWSMFTFNMSGINVQELIEKAADSAFDYRDGKIEYLATRVEQMLVEHREYRESEIQKFKKKIFAVLPLCVVGKRFANWLTFGYLLTKLLYVINCVSQIFIMQSFLHLNNKDGYSSNFGMEIARNIINGRNWEVTNVFPRVAYCMARVKHLGSVNVVTAQCVLTANVFIEKIYVFLWFWIVIVSIFTTVSLVLWLLRFLIPSRYCREIRKHLKIHGENTKDKVLIQRFCVEFLRMDGIFLLYMISINAGDLITTPLVNRLYKVFLEKYKDKNFTEKDDFSLIKNNKEADKNLMLLNSSDNDV